MIYIKNKFINLIIKKKVLQFGKFKLKSGRNSPYFFNSGILNTGKELHILGKIYAKIIVESKIKFDVIFGTAYKGIPIVTATAIALSKYYNLEIPYCFNRKEQKQYGDKGELIGSNIKEKKIIIIDDVITAGTSVKNLEKIIKEKKAQVKGIIVALDRQEKFHGEENISQYIKTKYACNLISIITIQDIISYISKEKNKKLFRNLEKMCKYYIKYSL
ncbi:Orotate phosphoribosyltransferase [Buchnera aphidicola (Neophyllaphis podocarpi)]